MKVDDAIANEVKEVNERIVKIIASEGLTASAFADKLGIQRSNISHIKNGRSGPGFELLQKILKTFPKYNAEWLVMGRGEIYRQPVQTSIFDILGDDGSAETDTNTATVNDENANNNTNAAPMPPIEAHQIQQPTEKEPVVNSEGREAESNQPAAPTDLTSVLTHAAQHQAEVKQVVVLYSDNTFVAYNKQ